MALRPSLTPVEVTGVAPNFEAFAGDALEEGGEGGEDHGVGLVVGQGDAVGHEGGDLLLDAHLEVVFGGDKPGGFGHFGGGVQVATDIKKAGGVGLGDQGVSFLGAAAGAGAFAGGGKFDFGADLRVDHEIGGAGRGTFFCGDHAGRGVGQVTERVHLALVVVEHGVGEHVAEFASFHVAVVVARAAFEFVHEKDAFQHGFKVTPGHEGAGHVDRGVQGHAVCFGEAGELAFDAVGVSQFGE